MDGNAKIDETRVRILNERDVCNGAYVLYWMQASQRAILNHALEYAAAEANCMDLPLLVGFGIMDDYPEANLRHYSFMVEGLQDTESVLKGRKIKLVVIRGHPAEIALKLGKRASLIVTDRGYLRHQKQWRKTVASEAACKVVQVETDVIVPVDIATGKREFAARTIRPRIHKHFENYLKDQKEVEIKNSSTFLEEKGLDLGNVEKFCASLKLDRSVSPVSNFFKGGTTEGMKRFRTFCKGRLSNYSKNRNHPETDDVSHMSKYLHFGMISPIWLLLELQKHAGPSSVDLQTYVEELLVRRELAINFVEFTPNYDSYECLPDWAKETLGKHARDKRSPQYTASELENAETHDEYWNASMLEMKHTGYMHNYMRMYWGKKILEWSSSPQHAYRTALSLNNKYFLDGRDPNSFANIAWVFGNHDRPWQEREIYGKVRCMMASGLERKCDIRGYVEKVEKWTSPGNGASAAGA